MWRRQQEGKPREEERVAAKSKPMDEFGIEDRKSVSNTWIRVHPTARRFLEGHSKSSDRPSTGKPVATGARDVNENAASSSQVWHQNENTRSSIGTPVCENVTQTQ